MSISIKTVWARPNLKRFLIFKFIDDDSKKKGHMTFLTKGNKTEEIVLQRKTAFLSCSKHTVIVVLSLLAVSCAYTSVGNQKQEVMHSTVFWAATFSTSFILCSGMLDDATASRKCSKESCNSLQTESAPTVMLCKWPRTSPFACFHSVFRINLAHLVFWRLSVCVAQHPFCSPPCFQ